MYLWYFCSDQLIRDGIGIITLRTFLIRAFQQSTDPCAFVIVVNVHVMLRVFIYMFNINIEINGSLMILNDRTLILFIG